MTFFERTFAEGTEEVMEEAFQDAIKGIFKAAEALGIPMNNEETKLDFGFSGQDVLQRYGMSFFGGLVGGAVFQGYNNLELGISCYDYYKHKKTCRQRFRMLRHCRSNLHCLQRRLP